MIIYTYTISLLRNLLALFHDIICSKKFNYLFRKSDDLFIRILTRKSTICFENKMFSFENMTFEKKVNYLVREYDVFVRKYDVS